MKTKIKTEHTKALKSGDSFRKNTLTLALSAITQVEVDTRKALTDADIIQILTKMVKQRKDSIAQFTQAGRVDLIDIEEREVNIIEEFLPQQISSDEVVGMIDEAITKLSASGIQMMGKVMAEIRPQLLGKFDMSEVSRLVKEKLG